jgi:predicted nucleic acid-binding protein
MNSSIVFWDTNLFIYLFEENPNHLDRVVGLFRAMRSRGDVLVTSALTVGEILVKPTMSNDKATAGKYLAYFRNSSIEVVEFGLGAAASYASIRVDRAIAKPDAIQLACAAARGVDLFITNDGRFSKKHIPGIRFISSLENAPI